MINYHIHTKKCGHATGEITEYIEEAKRLGLKEIGFSDHIPMYFLPADERDATIAMRDEELPLYVEDILLQQRLNPELTIRLGIEADYVPGLEKELKSILANFNFDYVLGSIHFLKDWGFDNPEYIEEYNKRNIDEIYDEYFSCLQQAAGSGLFDILAHPDLIKKFGFRAKKDLTKVYEDTVKIIKANDLCIELNTAGLRVPAKELYPSKKFLELCFDNNVPITIGTDAHCPNQVGMGLKEGYQLLKEVGYRKVAVFEKRKRSFLDI